MTPSKPPSRYTILVVDDSPEYQKILSRIIQSAGYKLFTARSAEEAEQALSVRVPDVALLDWNLPGKSGLELAQRFRQDPRCSRMILIMLSVHSRPQEQAQGLTEGKVNMYLTKPVNPAELLARIDGLLKKRDQPPPQ